MPSDSAFIRHEPCPACGSSDGLGRYTDGHGHCFVCEHYEPGDGQAPSPTNKKRKAIMDDLIQGTVQAIAKRHITEDTCRKFGYHISLSLAIRYLY